MNDFVFSQKYEINSLIGFYFKLFSDIDRSFQSKQESSSE